MNKKYIVRLSDEERGSCQEVIKNLKGSSQKFRRAQILLKADADGPAWPDFKIAEAFTRALVGVVEIWLLLAIPALVSGLVSAKGKRLGDYAAGTYVVRERVRMTIPPPPAMPPALAGWAVGADIARLPDGLAMAVRQFLGRAAGLSPASRASIAAELQAEVLRHVAPPPPAGSHPEMVLTAVIADPPGKACPCQWWLTRTGRGRAEGHPHGGH